MLCNTHSCGLQVTLSVGLSAVVCIMAEVIPSHTDGTPHIAQGMRNITYNQNPAYMQKKVFKRIQYHPLTTAKIQLMAFQILSVRRNLVCTMYSTHH